MSTVTGLANNPAANGDAIKQQLIECLKNEKQDFMSFAKAFYQQPNRSREDYIAMTQAIVEAVDHVLLANNWDESLFLRSALKPLRELREEAQTLLNEVQSTDLEVGFCVRPLADDEILAYIAIFQSQGHLLRRWELQLNSISSYLLGRPVYDKEEAVDRVIKRKLQQGSEAYIVVAIKKRDVQSFAHQAERVDRLGNPLLTLREGAVKPENILEFVHQGERYFFVNGHLVPQQH